MITVGLSGARVFASVGAGVKRCQDFSFLFDNLVQSVKFLDYHSLFLILHSSATMASASQPDEGLTPVSSQRHRCVINIDVHLQAQRMAAQHAAAEESHKTTVEDVEDEADIGHPHTLDAPAEQQSIPSNEDPIPSSAKGKGKAVDAPAAPQTNGKPKARPLDTQSEEAFPSLGPKKGDPLAGATAWGAKPASLSAAGRTAAPSTGKPMTMPSRNVHHSITIRKDEFKPSNELKKPLADIIRNHNKRSKAPVKATGSAGGMTFSAEGPNMDLVNQSLKVIANEVCAKVCLVLGFLRKGSQLT